MRPWASRLALAALCAPALAHAGGCAFDRTGLPAASVVRDDSAADFGAAGATLEDAEVEPVGLVTPAAYVTGALVAKGANSQLFTDPTTAAWTTLDAATPAATALALPLGDYGSGSPAGVGVTQGDNFTVWLAGDVWLEAGAHTFELTADDAAFLDLAPPGGAFTRVVTAWWYQGARTGTFTAPSDGWYQLHAAMVEQGGTATFLLRHQPPGAAGLAPFDPDRARVPAAGQQGLVADAFDDYYVVRPIGRSLRAGAALDQDFGAAVPANTGITEANAYSLHWAGQVRVDTGGDYALRVDTDDGHRLRVDGALVLDHMVAASEVATTDPLHLDPGWHDVVLELGQYGGSSHAHLHVASGPDLVGGPFPADRVRPVVPRADRVAGDVDDSSLPFAAGGSVTFDLAPPAPATGIVDGVDVTYIVAVPHLRDVQVTVIAPDGTRAIVRAQGDTDHVGTTGERRTTHALDGKAAGGAWHLEVADKGGVNPGGAKSAELTVHYVGGRPPIVPAAAYDSAVKDLGAPSHLDEVSYGAYVPTGAGVVVRLRAGATAAACMAAAWSDPVTSGQPPIVSPGQFVQYRVELSSDGDHAATFDWIELVYRAER